MVTDSPLPTIVIDTREQEPWEFRGPSVRGTLRTGDYSVLGLETIVAIERKSLADFVGSLTQGRERFMREVGRLREYRFRAIIVEASVEAVWAKSYRSAASPQSIMASAMALTFGASSDVIGCAADAVPVIWAGCREHAAWCCEWALRRIASKHNIEVDNESTGG